MHQIPVDEIKKIFSNLEITLEGFAPREEQKRMIFEIAKSLTQESNGVVVCEAGTGVGKSLGYLISTIPIALKQDKKVIISTATIALQEQLINKDIPLFAKVFDKHITYELAKGRGNYICQQSLYERIGEIESTMPLFGLKKGSDNHLIHEMFKAYQNKTWDGERATYKTAIPDPIWQSLQSDPHRCNKKDHPSCPFHLARDKLSNCDIIVANHALVISDLSIMAGGGAILPPADQTIYVFDEAHHLPKIAREAVSGSFSITPSIEIGSGISSAMSKHIKKSVDVEHFNKQLSKTNPEKLKATLEDMETDLKSVANYYLNSPTSFEDGVYLARDPKSAELDLLNTLLGTTNKVHREIASLNRRLGELIPDGLYDTEGDKEKIQQAISDFKFFQQRLDNIESVLTDFVKANNDRSMAKWVTHHQQKGFSVHTSPVDAAKTLKELLWDHAEQVILTSATLASLSSKPPYKLNIDLYRRESGLPNHALSVLLGSPFDYPNVSTLHLPREIDVSPKEKDAFTHFLQDDLFPKYIEGQTATLVLFSSYWQMNDVYEQIKNRVTSSGYEIQQQGEKSKEAILLHHKQCIDEGKPSILFGTGSFAEGLDLPRKLLTNVIITKLPFGMPSDPVSIFHTEYIEKQGGNSFFDISLPDTSRQLIQAVGRLIRTKDDKGRIIILDNRMTKASYGPRLRQVLPPFKISYENPQ